MTGGAERTPRNAPSGRERTEWTERTERTDGSHHVCQGEGPRVRVRRPLQVSGSFWVPLGRPWATVAPRGGEHSRVHHGRVCHPRWGEIRARDTSCPRQLGSPPRPFSVLGRRRSGRAGSYQALWARRFHIRAPARPDVFVQAMIATADRCGPLPQRLSRRPDAPVCAFCALWAGCRSGNRRRAPRTLRRSEAFRPVSGTA